MGDAGLPMRGPSLERQRVGRIEDLGRVRDLVGSSHVLFVELVPRDGESIDDLDAPLLAVAERQDRELIAVESEITVRDAADAATAASCAQMGLTRIDVQLPDPGHLPAMIRVIDNAVRGLGGGVWRVDDQLFVAAPFDITRPRRRGGGRGDGAGDRAPLVPANPYSAGSIKLPLPKD